MNPINFLKEVKTELTKVVWPTRQQTVQLTILVLAISILIGAYIGGLDFIFTSITNRIIVR